MEEVRDLESLLERIEAAGGGDRVSVGELLDSVGQRSFGPLLLVPSLLLVSPLSGIPGSGTLGGMVIALVSGHLVLGFHRLWLPGFLLRRRIERRRLEQAMRYLRPVATVADRFIKPRLAPLTGALGARVIGLVCLCIAVLMPPLELVPLANSTTAAAVASFALALVARDGLLVLLAGAFTGVGIYLGLEVFLV